MVQEKQGRIFNLESVSEEEIQHEAHLVEEQRLHEVWRRRRNEHKKMSEIFKHVWGSMKLWAGGIVVTELILFVDDVRRNTASTPTSVEEPNKKCPCCGTHLHD